MTTPSWADIVGDRVVVLDGGLSTQLERRGQGIGGPLWTARALLERPDAVTAAHADFAAAGAEVLISASYQVSREGFVAAGLSAEDADRALAASVATARAAGDGVVVAASVGPYGAILHDGSEYRGDYGLGHDALVAFHSARVEVLAEAAPDLLAVETIPDVREAEALVDVLARVPEIPAWVTFSTRDDARLWAGQAIEEAILVATGAPNVVAIGVNCTDPRWVPRLIERMSAATPLPVIVYPNAGGAWDPGSEQWDGSRRGSGLGEAATAWVAAGAAGVGGCCGTDADDIRIVAAAVRRTAP